MYYVYHNYNCVSIDFLKLENKFFSVTDFLLGKVEFQYNETIYFIIHVLYPMIAIDGREDSNKSVMEAYIVPFNYSGNYVIKGKATQNNQ